MLLMNKAFSAEKFYNQKSPFPVGDQDISLTQCYVGPHECPCQMASHSVKQLEQGAQV